MSTVEEVLRALYRLQQIDLELDELDEGSGDLPSEVEELKQRIDGIDSSISEEESKLHELRRGRNSSTTEMDDLRERVRMLNERLRTVRNNKEYEATTNDIAAAEADLQSRERGMSSLDTDEAQLMRRIEALGRQRDELVAEVEEKTGTLKMLHETHADEITELKGAREEVLSQIGGDLLKKYQHIRTAYNDAVVKVRKGACSGCYRAITPQTIVEMRRNEQIFNCEHCGRILVDEETVASVSV